MVASVSLSISLSIYMQSGKSLINRQATQGTSTERGKQRNKQRNKQTMHVISFRVIPFVLRPWEL